MFKTKKILALALAFLICMGNVFACVQEAKADNAPVLLNSELQWETMPTGTDVFIYYNESNIKYRWNINGTGKAKGQCVHLDDKDGKNWQMRLGRVKVGNVQYYTIKYLESDSYIDTEGNNSKEDETLHQYKKDPDQDNQYFRFVPVDGKTDVYYILSKKGDDAGKSLYVGFHKDENAIGEKTELATSSTPVEWRISTTDFLNTVDMKGGEKKFEKNHLIATFTPEGFNCDINVQDEWVSVDGTDLHLFFLGTASKFELEWNENYKGYYLHQREIDESKPNELNLVWDVEGQKTADDTQIHLWSQKEYHPSQIWRFIPQGDNVYHIYNAFTGKYLSVRAAKDQDQNGIKIVQNSTPMRWEVNLLDLEKQNTESANWMANLPDSMSLGEVNMPGTHDTGATKMRGEDGVAIQSSETQCQQLYPYEQLNMGVRAFDVRCDYTDDDNSDGSPDIVHGDSIFQCQNKDGSSMRLSNIMYDAKKFVTNHPSECVIVTIKADGWAGGNDGNVARAVEEYVLDEHYPLWRENRIPTLGEARGKIILLRRYEMGNHVLNSNIEEWELGFNLSSWDDYDYTKLSKSLEIFSMDVDDGDKNSNTITQNKVYVQDYYSTDKANVKMAWLNGTIVDATQNSLTNKAYIKDGKTIQQYAYLFNFIACRDKISVARETNLAFMEDEAGNIVQGNTLGIVMFNFVDFKTARKVWQTNYGSTVRSVQRVLSSEEHGISVSGMIQAGATCSLSRGRCRHGVYHIKRSVKIR